jgi:hypothetical protein
MVDSLTFGQSDWIPAVAVVGCVLFLLVVLSYIRAQLSWPIKIISILLRSLAIGLVLFSLLDPMIARQRPKSQSNWLGLVVDDSRSMKALIADKNSDFDEAKLSSIWRDRLSSNASWQQKIEDDFRVSRYRFGSRLESIDDMAEIGMNQNQSSIANSIQLLAERLEGVPTAGVLLFSDGQGIRANQTSLISEQRDWKSVGFPIYPVDLGELAQKPDLRLSTVSVKQSDFEAAPVTINAMIENDGLTGRTVQITLIDSESKTVQTQKVKLDRATAGTPIEFRFRPEQSGVQSYRIVASLLEEVTQTPTSSPSKPTSENGNSKGSRSTIERTLLNNERSIVVDRGHGPYPILYIAGRPNWEHKFLRRAIAEDAELQMVSLVRIAKKEPKFSFRDSKIDSANPLFSGFEDVTDEEKEQYNEPVFARLGVTDGQQLQKGFPGTAEELFKFKAIIIDDIEYDFFSADQQSLLRQFVSIRGGGLLFLGGSESMRGKGFRESVLAQILPVYGEDRIESSNQLDMKHAPAVRYNLTREGWLEPFLRTADNESAEQKQLDAMPTLKVLNEAGGLKPGAIVLAEAESNDATKQNKPALIAQRFGKGKSACLLIGDMWRWGLHHESSTSAPLYQAWRQMIRWLIAEVPNPIAMSVEPAVASSSGQSAKLKVSVRTADFKLLDNVEVQIEVIRPDSADLKGAAEPTGGKSGEYEFPLLTENEGAYKARATVLDRDGSTLGTTQVGWVHEPSIVELEKLGTNRAFLEKIARETGGEMLSPTDLDSFAKRIQGKPLPISQIELEPLWHQSWLLGLVLGCLGTEWWLRRRNGLR